MSAARWLASSNAAPGIIGAAIAVAIWEVRARTGVIDPALCPSPFLAIREAAQRLTMEPVAGNLAWSLMRVFFGFLLGAIAGAAISVAAGWYGGFGSMARQVIELLRPIPRLPGSRSQSSGLALASLQQTDFSS